MTVSYNIVRLVVYCLEKNNTLPTEREAVPQACGLRNGLSGRQGGVHLPQWRGDWHKNLKKAAGRFRGLSDILSAVFVYGNLLISHSPYS